MIGDRVRSVDADFQDGKDVVGTIASHSETRVFLSGAIHRYLLEDVVIDGERVDHPWWAIRVVPVDWSPPPRVNPRALAEWLLDIPAPQ